MKSKENKEFILAMAIGVLVGCIAIVIEVLIHTHTHTNETLEKLGSPEGEHYCRFIWDCPSGVLDIYICLHGF